MHPVRTPDLHVIMMGRVKTRQMTKYATRRELCGFSPWNLRDRQAQHIWEIGYSGKNWMPYPSALSGFICG